MLELLFIGLTIYVVILSIKVKKLENWVRDGAINGTKKEGNQDIALERERTATQKATQVSIASEPGRNYRRIEVTNQEKDALNHKDIVQKKEGKIQVSMASILSKMGIGFLLIGVGLLFKWGYAQGFITEFFTLILGAFIGWGLIAFGRVAFNKKRFIVSQVVYGGGIATLYITVYGAYGVYHMLNNFLAFILLVFVGMIAFFISLTHQNLSLSITALLGSLSIPLIVDIQFIGFLGFGIYVIALAILNGMIFYYKRWRSLQVLSIIGIYGLVYSVATQISLSMEQKIELGLLLFTLCILFIAQELLMIFRKRIKGKDVWISNAFVVVLSLFTIIANKNLMSWSSQGWTLCFVGVALLYFSLFYWAYIKKYDTITNDTLLLLMSIFVYLAIVQFWDGYVEQVILLLMGHTFFYFYHRRKEKVFQWIGHGVSGIAWIFIINTVMGIKTFYIGTTILVYLLMIGLIFWQKGWKRQLYGTLIFLGYGTLVNTNIIYSLWSSEYEFMMTIMLSVTVVRFFYLLILWCANQRYKIMLPYVLPVYGFLLFKTQVEMTFSLDIWAYKSLHIFWFILALMMGGALFSIGLYMQKKEQKEGRIYYILGVLILMWSSFFDITLIKKSSRLSVLSMGVSIIVIIKIVKKVLGRSDIILKIYRWIFFGFYGLLFIVFGWRYTFSWINFVIDIALFCVFVWHLYDVSKKMTLNYTVLVAVFYLNTYVIFIDVAAGSVTLLWAMMSVGGLIYGIIKRNQKFSYVALGTVVFVAARFVLIDLVAVEVQWKVITSMIFGGALLAISYFLQPYFEIENIKE